MLYIGGIITTTRYRDTFLASLIVAFANNARIVSVKYHVSTYVGKVTSSTLAGSPVPRHATLAP